MTIQARPKIVHRVRPYTAIQRPKLEVQTSHSALCPHCSRETRVLRGASGVIYGSCGHFKNFEERGDQINVIFESAR